MSQSQGKAKPTRFKIVNYFSLFPFIMPHYFTWHLISSLLISSLPSKQAQTQHHPPYYYSNSPSGRSSARLEVQVEFINIEIDSQWPFWFGHLGNKSQVNEFPMNVNARCCVNNIPLYLCTFVFHSCNNNVMFTLFS